MTLHIILPTEDRDRCPDGFVWIADNAAKFEWGNGSIDKIRHLKKQAVACSAWGSYALDLRDDLAEMIERGVIELSESDSERNRAGLEEFVKTALAKRKESGSGKFNGGLIVVTLFKPLPLIYVVTTEPPKAAPGDLGTWFIGDPHNPAEIFVSYYYARSTKSYPEALLLGIHAMRLARDGKRDYIGEPNAWVYERSEFHRLSLEELAAYVKRSERIDEAIFAEVARVALKREMSEIEKKLRGLT